MQNYVFLRSFQPRNMKRAILMYLCIAWVLMSSTTAVSSAQTVPSKYTFDTDFLMLSNTIDPDFRHHYDDWTQYAPAAVMVGLKACGYKGRSTWGRMLVSDAFSVAAMAQSSTVSNIPCRDCVRMSQHPILSLQVIRRQLS